MKKIIIMLSLTLVSWSAFAQQENSDKNNSKLLPTIILERSNSASAIIDNYLALKDALVQEDSKNSADFGKKMLSNFLKFDMSKIAKEKKNKVINIINDAKQQAKYIAENSGNIAKQREHFEFLTVGVKELIVIAGSDRTLYHAYCPMFNNNKGAFWLSTSKEINNPYFGSKMLKCGSVLQEILLENK